MQHAGCLVIERSTTLSARRTGRKSAGRRGTRGWPSARHAAPMPKNPTIVCVGSAARPPLPAARSWWRPPAGPASWQTPAPSPATCWSAAWGRKKLSVLRNNVTTPPQRRVGLQQWDEKRARTILHACLVCPAPSGRLAASVSCRGVPSTDHSTHSAHLVQHALQLAGLGVRCKLGCLLSLQGLSGGGRLLQQCRHVAGSGARRGRLGRGTGRAVAAWLPSELPGPRRQWPPVAAVQEHNSLNSAGEARAAGRQEAVQVDHGRAPPSATTGSPPCASPPPAAAPPPGCAPPGPSPGSGSPWPPSPAQSARTGRHCLMCWVLNRSGFANRNKNPRGHAEQGLRSGLLADVRLPS